MKLKHKSPKIHPLFWLLSFEKRSLKFDIFAVSSVARSKNSFNSREIAGENLRQEQRSSKGRYYSLVVDSLYMYIIVQNPAVAAVCLNTGKITRWAALNSWLLIMTFNPV